MAEIDVYPDADALARAAAELFAKLIEEAIAARGRFTVALSGGSTPKAMHVHLRGLPVNWSYVHIFWSDERCVPPNHEHSNYRMARETLLNHIAIPEQNVRRIRGEAEPEQAASEYEALLRATQPPVFDLIFLGLGDDGHTASIFPGASAVQEQTRWVVAQEHNFPPPPLVSRITFTPPLINDAANVIFLVAGASKAERLKQVLHGPYQPEILPAQMVKPMNGKLIWIVDEAAAKNL